MSRTIMLMSALLVAGILVSACAQPTSAPAPTATSAAAASTSAAASKPAEPTKAPQSPAVAATAPVKAVDYPVKGRSITFIVPWGAGGPNDVASRIAAARMEKELGVPITIVNKPGASGQVGVTELALAKPDGYTIGGTQMPATILSYLDVERKAAFSRKSFQPLAMFAYDAGIIAVANDSKYKTAKDLVEAAKAKPGGILVGASGVLSGSHLSGLQFQQAAGVKFAWVQFDSAPNAITALLGGNLDALSLNQSALFATVKGGQARLLGIMDQNVSKFYPDTPTMESQGYKVNAGGAYTMSAPVGVSPEIVSILDTATRKAMESDDVKKKMDEMALTWRYMDSKAYAAEWEALEKQVETLMPLAKE